MGNLPKNQYLSIDKAAKKLGVSTKTLRRWEASGKLVAVRTKGGHRRYILSQLKELTGTRTSNSSQYFKYAKTEVKETPKSEKSYSFIIPTLPKVSDEDLYRPLVIHGEQKSALKYFAIFAFSSILLFSVLNTSDNLFNGLNTAKRNLYANLPFPGVVKTLTTSYQSDFNLEENIATSNINKKVLAAQDSVDTPIFNVNIKSRFNQIADFINGLTASSVNTGTLIATDSATFEDTIAVTGNATFANDLDVSGDITSTSTTFNLLNTGVTTLNIGRASTTTSISSTTGTTTINNNFVATGSITGSSTLSIAGASILSGDVTAGGDVDIDDDLSIGGTLDVDGSSTFGNITAINGVTYSFPTSQGASSSTLTNDGSGNLTWTAAGASGITGSGTTNTIPKFNSASTIADSLLTDSGTILAYNSVFSVNSSGALSGITSLTAPATVTTGNGFNISSSTLTTGNLVKVTSTSTGLSSAKLFNVDSSGSNSNSSVTNYGIYSTITNTGSSSTNVAGYFSASGATNNYGLLVPSGFVGVGTTTPSSQFDISAVATGGSIFNLDYDSSTVLSGDLTAASINLDTTNLTANNISVTGVNVKLPTVTNNGSGTYTLNGIYSNFGTGGGINTTGSGTTTYNGANLAMPALTQTSGTLVANGLLVTTPSGITTGGTANGINLSTTGVSAGSLRGLNIGSITGGSGTEDAINIGSGWDSILKVNSTTIINGSGVTQVAGGGTGQSSYTTGDILYASNSNTLTKLGVGSDGYVLTVSSGVPIWNTVTGSSCTNCLVNNPSANQTITPTGDSTGLSVRQTATGSPTADIFSITNNGGGTKYFYVDSAGVVNIPSIGSSSSDQLTITPGTDKFALKLLGTNVASNSLQLIDSYNTSGNIFDIDYIASTSLAGTLIGMDVNLSTNVTATNQSVYGGNIVLPSVTNTHTSGTKNLTGLQIAAGGGLNQNGAGGTTQFAGVDITIPALTQSAGTIAGYGVNITTPSSVTTGGTANGINISASGVGAGTLNGIAISSITGGSGTETGLSIGSGWDTAISLVGGGTIGATTTGLNLQADGSVDVNIAGGSSTTGCTVTNSTGDLTCTGNITGASTGISGFWTLAGGVLYPTTTTNDFAVGGTTLAASVFGIDESAATVYLGADNSANPLIIFESTDVGETGTLGFNTNDAFYFSDANVGIGTTAPDAALEINHATGDSLRLTYNDSDGSASAYTDFSLASDGDLTIDSAGGNITAVDVLDIAPTTTGSFLRFLLETEWTGGTLINARFGSATTQTTDIVGSMMNFNSNFTGAADQDIVGYRISTPALTQSTTATTNYFGYTTGTVGDLVQDTAAGTIAYRGANLGIPNITQTTGTITAYGYTSNNGTITTGGTMAHYHVGATGVGAGTLYGLNIAAITAGAGTEQAINIGTGWDLDINVTTSLDMGVGGTAELALSATNLTPGAAEGNSLGSSSAEWEQLFLGDDNGLAFGLDQDWTLGYDETTDDRLELVTSGTSGMLIQSATLTGTGLSTVFNSLTSGTGLAVSSTSTALTSGKLASFDWSPGSSSTATGDLFNINIGTNGTTTGNLFSISDTGSAIFSVSEAQITSALPHQFTAPGDVAAAYDLQFTNPTSSFIKSNAALYAVAGETFNSSNLTLRSYNLGNILLDTGTSSTGSGKVGIGPAVTPVGLLHVSNTAQSLTIGKALAIFDQGETQDILTASASGTAKFSVASTGILTLTNSETIDNNTTNGTIALNANSGTLTLDVNGEIKANLNNAGSSTEAVCGTSASEDATDSTIDDCTTSVNADYAEFYPTENNVEYGDVVAIGPNTINSEYKGVTENGGLVSLGGYNTAKLEKTTSAYQDAIGIVSNNWSDFSSTGKSSVPESEHPLPVALNGRVPVKVTATSDAIQPGDYIAASTEEGRAMKATKAGFVIGRALESWDPLTGRETVMVFVKNTYYTPTPSFTEALESATESAQFSENFQNLNTTKLTVLEDAVLADTVINGKLNVGGLTLDNVEQSINAIGVLKIQDLALGNIEFMNGLITFETDGSAKFESVTANKYKVAGTSAGNAVIKAGQTSTIITTTQVKNNSLIFVTAQTATGRTLAVTQKTDSTSFKVELNGTDSKDINFNWWIVDKE